MKELQFWKCPVCGKLVWEVNESGSVPICCGRAMIHLQPEADEGPGEKHIPVSVLKDGILTVRVGAVPHPALPAHHIEWIALQCPDRTGFRFLAADERPEVCFDAECLDPEAVYIYCNIHGLWKGGVVKE